MKVRKVFNNNVILACDEAGDEEILMGLGIGFQAKPGMDVDLEKVQRRFSPSPGTPTSKIVAYLDEIDPEALVLAEEVMQMGRAEFGKGVSDAMLLPFADHINVALLRASKNIEVDYPLSWEVRGLYPREVEFGKKAVAHIRARTGKNLPELECIPFALHFANAQFDSGDMSATIRLTRSFGKIFSLLSELFGQELDLTSMAVARFIAHLRFLDMRMGGTKKPEKDMSAILRALEETRPEEIMIARRLARELETMQSWTLSETDVLFLALHMCHLRDSLSEAPAA